MVTMWESSMKVFKYNIAGKWPYIPKVPPCFFESLGVHMKMWGGPAHFELSKNGAVNRSVHS